MASQNVIYPEEAAASPEEITPLLEPATVKRSGWRRAMRWLRSPQRWYNRFLNRTLRAIQPVWCEPSYGTAAIGRGSQALRTSRNTLLHSLNYAFYSSWLLVAKVRSQGGRQVFVAA